MVLEYQTCLIFHRLLPTGQETTTDHVNNGSDPEKIPSYRPVGSSGTAPLQNRGGN